MLSKLFNAEDWHAEVENSEHFIYCCRLCCIDSLCYFKFMLISSNSKPIYVNKMHNYLPCKTFKIRLNCMPSLASKQCFKTWYGNKGGFTVYIGNCGNWEADVFQKTHKQFVERWSTCIMQSSSYNFEESYSGFSQACKANLELPSYFA